MSSWTGVCEAYRDSFATLCAGTVDIVIDALPDDPLADVGCGTGSVLGAARERGREALGIDSDPDMVAMARRATGATVVHGVLPNLSLADDAFASVAANFVINHVPDPRAAMRELARILGHRGRLAATIWPSGGGGWTDLVGACFEAADATAVVAPGLPPDLDFPRTVEGLADLAKGAGLHVLDARQVGWEWAVPPQALWAGISGGVASPGQRFLAQTPAVRLRIEEEFVRRTSEVRSDGLLRFPSRAVFVVAEKRTRGLAS